MAAEVRKSIITEVRKSKYFAIMVDSTPDIAHIDQFAVVVRYVHFKPGLEPVIRTAFLGFVQMGKDATSVSNGILQFLADIGIDFDDCRGQCYDNATVMSGDVRGVQRQLLEKNPQAAFINCDNHSLNLAGKNAVDTDVGSHTFFFQMEDVYHFFASSTSRWELLVNAGITVTRATDTRWSSNKAAVTSMCNGLSQILAILEDIDSSPTSHYNKDTRAGASRLLSYMLTFEFMSYLHYWKAILSKIDAVQKKLQGVLDLVEASDHLTALAGSLEAERERDNLFQRTGSSRQALLLMGH